MPHAASLCDVVLVGVEHIHSCERIGELKDLALCYSQSDHVSVVGPSRAYCLKFIGVDMEGEWTLQFGHVQ